mmetsp:Transcript_5004/g.7946  ORF Transcript_5004/g.7946 Transcript_5004/m.7946 type:complete len:82 (-) Transcript_5004:245-490(-)
MQTRGGRTRSQSKTCKTSALEEMNDNEAQSLKRQQQSRQSRLEVSGLLKNPLVILQVAVKHVLATGAAQRVPLWPCLSLEY